MKAKSADALVAKLLESEGSANAATFLRLCRQWPELRTWLVGSFARSPAVREKFEQVVDRKIPPPRNRGRWLAEMDGDDSAYHREMEHLRQHMFPRGPGVCGGLTWVKIQELIRRHQSGTLDLGAFMLAREWRKAGDAALSSFRLQRSAAVFVDAVVRTGRPRLLRHFAKALRLLKECDTKSKRRALLGHDWWKLNVLIYMHRHPCDGYRTRDLRAHLATLGLNVTTKAIRRFCNHHGIRRDERAGRPRTKSHQDTESLGISRVGSVLSPSNVRRRGSPGGHLVRPRGERRRLTRASTA